MNTLPKIKTADMVQYRRNYYQARKARGLCPGCGQPLSAERKEAGRVYCVTCTANRP